MSGYIEFLFIGFWFATGAVLAITSMALLLFTLFVALSVLQGRKYREDLKRRIAEREAQEQAKSPVQGFKERTETRLQ